MLIRWLVNAENSDYWFQQTHQTPARLSMYEGLTDYEELPRKIFFDELINWGQERPPSPAYREFSEIFIQGMGDIVRGADVEESVAQMVTDIDEALESYR